MKKLVLAIGMAFVASQVDAAPFTFVHPDFTAELVVVGGGIRTAGVTMGLDGMLYTNDDGGSVIAKWNLGATTLVNGSNIATLVASSSSAAGAGWGMATRSNGEIFSLGSGQLYRINQTTLSGELIGSAGTYGLAYNASDDMFYSSAGSSIIRTDPDGGVTAVTVSSIPQFIDQVAVDPTGQFIVGADLSEGAARIWNIATGALVVAVDLNGGRLPDGIAFDANGNIFTNNTDGSVLRIEFGVGGYATGIVTQTLIASGGFYGDLAGVGTDGAFYLSQYGTQYANGATDGGSTSIVRLTCNTASVGSPCFVDGGVGGSDPGDGGEVPEPFTLSLLGVGLVGIGMARRRPALRPGKRA